MSKRHIYLDNIPLEEAENIYQDFLQTRLPVIVPIEEIPVTAALGRVTAEAVYAVNSSPHYHAAAMDGIAVRAEDTYGASETNPKRLKADQFQEVDTGDPLPPTCNAVVMAEHVHYHQGEAEIIEPVAPWQHVRTLGEDLVKGEMILSSRHQISPVDIGALLAGGITVVKVIPRVRIAILPTGTELVKPGTTVQPGDIIEFNGAMLAALAQSWGADVEVVDAVPDDYQLIKNTLSKLASAYDIVVVNAGSSAGREDFSAKVIGELGQVVVHGVAIKPGKPVILGGIGSTPVIGIPGYPVSAYLTFELFVKPLVYRLQGLSTPTPEQVPAVTARKIVSPLGQEEFVRVKLGKIGSRLIAVPVSRGAGVVTSLVKADGILRVPRLSEGLQAGEEVTVRLLRKMDRLEQTIVITGSHDLCLDILHDCMTKAGAGYLSSAHVGSTGGLLALRRQESHGAGVHLLDPETGEYNIPYIEKYLANYPLILMNLIYRQQGLLIPPDNPKNINGLEDLSRPELIYINRQPGSGTRILLDYYLGKLGLTGNRVNGYQREEATHLGVAVAVAAGTADCGLGIKAAAQAMDLAFIPVAEERYDLLFPQEYWDMPQIQSLRDTISGLEFQSRVESLGGYSLRDTGKIIWRNC